MAAEIGVIVSARNEADRVLATIAALRDAFGAEVPIVVADDASTDATAAIAEGSGATVVRAPRHLGKGGAATLASERLLATSAPRRVVLCDADLGESAAELAALAHSTADVTVAAFRRSRGGGFGIALRFASWAIADLTGMRPAAPISGQRALTRAALEAVLPFAPGFGMEIGMTVDATRAGMTFAELPLDLEHRAHGRSLRGFAHRAAQLVDFARVYVRRRRGNRAAVRG